MDKAQVGQIRVELQSFLRRSNRRAKPDEFLYPLILCSKRKKFERCQKVTEREQRSDAETGKSALKNLKDVAGKDLSRKLYLRAFS